MVLMARFKHPGTHTKMCNSYKSPNILERGPRFPAGDGQTRSPDPAARDQIVSRRRQPAAPRLERSHYVRSPPPHKLNSLIRPCMAHIRDFLVNFDRELNLIIRDS